MPTATIGIIREAVDDHIKQHNEENEDREAHHVNCELYAERTMRCRYMSITHPQYHSSCSMLELMQDVCHRMQHISMSYSTGESFCY